MNNALNPKITMMTYKDGRLSGNVVLNGQEWAVKPFEVELGMNATDKENALLKQAIKEHGE